jgi:predicted alpha/beta superfamily hydrolase
MKEIAHLTLFLLSFHVLIAQKPADIKDTEPFSFGVIDKIQSTELAESRTLNIYLPEGYNKDSATLYPVVYLLDGSANEDYPHIAGLVQFLNMSDLMPKTIVVGIANVDRKRDFTFPTTIAADLKDYPTTGKSEKFMAFIENELQPYIQKKYKVSTTKTIIGQSLGGLLATEILAKKSHLFDTYIIVSPSLWWDNQSLLLKLPEYLKTTPCRNKKIYLAGGNEHPVMVRDTKALAESLEKNIPSDSKLLYKYFAEENHATILHTSIYAAFILLNKK